MGAAVALREGSTATPEDIIEFTKERIAAYKYPRKVWVVELPKGPTGKILRREVQLRGDAGLDAPRPVGVQADAVSPSARPRMPSLGAASACSRSGSRDSRRARPPVDDERRAEDDDEADDLPRPEPLAEHQHAEEHRHHRDEVGDGRPDHRSGAADDVELEHVGEARPHEAEHERAHERQPQPRAGIRGRRTTLPRAPRAAATPSRGSPAP